MGRLPLSIGSYPTQWMVRRMYSVDVYLRVRRAVVEGMSVREAARTFGLHRDTVRKMLAYPVPQGYRRQTPPRRPKLEPFTGVIDHILDGDHHVPKKQRHTAKRIFERLRDEYGFDGGYTMVKDYVREHRRRTREMFVPLSHPPGHAQCDFGEALVLARRLLGSSERIPRRRVAPVGNGVRVAFRVPVRKRVKHVWTYCGAVSWQLRPTLAAQHRLGKRRRGPNPVQAVARGKTRGLA